MERAEIREAMDACRPEGDDLLLPELAPLAERLSADPALRRLFDRLQRLDRRLISGTLDVPVPAGLADRILARAQMASVDAGASVSGSTDNDEIASRVTAAEPTRHRLSRRGWLFAAVAASVIVGVSVALWPRPADLTADFLLNNSGDWAKQVWSEPANWRLFSAGQHEWPNHPMPAAIVAPPSRWADVSGLIDASAVAYDLNTAGGPRAMLFVVRNAEIDADTAPPASPQSSTGGMMIGCWQSQGLVYVLVVEGDERSYKSLLKPVPVRPFA